MVIKEKICGIYKIVNPFGNIYIGQSKDILIRKNKYRIYNCKDQCKIYNSLKKYGWNAHKFEIIHQCEPIQLNELEIAYIEWYNCFDTEHGLNLKSGGDSKINLSKESKKKISNSNKGNKNFLNKKHSEETKNIMRLLAIGSNNHFFNKTHSLESKEKMSKKRKGKQTGCLNPMAKKIIQKDLQGNFIKNWDCIKDAANEFNILISSISNNLSGHSKSCNGYKWSYAEKENTLA